MSKKLTPWFPASVKPFRVGLYERDYAMPGSDVPDFWDGKEWWIVPVGEPERRLRGFLNLRWRGLAKKP